jgi:hypothetical protein
MYVRLELPKLLSFAFGHAVLQGLIWEEARSLLRVELDTWHQDAGTRSM